MIAGNDVENNYFMPWCSAKLLCYEQESAFFDSPIRVAIVGATNLVEVLLAFAQAVIEFACEPGTTGYCDTIKLLLHLPPDDSTCWQWWDAPRDRVLPAGIIFLTEYDYKPCQATAYACDSYYCDSAWDLSCYEHHLQEGDSVNNNYFVDQCSAKILCCEPDSAFPKPLAGRATVNVNEEILIKEKIVTKCTTLL